jgi:hypothetical protein
MSLSNFQLYLLLEELDKRMKPLKDAVDKHPSLTQMDMLQAAHDTGRLMGILQTKALITDMMNEAEDKRRIELEKFKESHQVLDPCDEQVLSSHPTPQAPWEYGNSAFDESAKMTTEMDDHGDGCS